MLTALDSSGVATSRIPSQSLPAFTSGKDMLSVMQPGAPYIKRAAATAADL